MHHDQVGYPRDKKIFFDIYKSISVIHHIKKLRIKPYDLLNRCRKHFLTKFSTYVLKKNKLGSGNGGNIDQHN